MSRDAGSGAKARLLVVLGPTATGKTAAALYLAEALDGEIVSADSMLIYRGFDIGTAKPTSEELAAVPHHLIDIKAPEEPSTVIEWRDLAKAAITDITRRGKLPILTGGTGLYIKALLEDYRFPAAPGEVSRERTYSGSDAGELAYDAYVAGLRCDRVLLYERINRRVDMMMAAGFLGEVKGLLNTGLSRSRQSLRSIGYRELAAHLAGEMPLDVAVDEIKKATRHFAKRQFTWYRQMSYIKWYDVAEGSVVYPRILTDVRDFWQI